MNIRIFEEKDSVQIQTLFDEFGDIFVDLDPLKFVVKAPTYAKTFFKEMLENTSTDGIVYVAEDNNQVVGFIAGNIHELTLENTVENIPMRKGRILELFVTADYRNKGVGKLLVEKLEDFFKSNNCHTINVEVFAPNEKAQKFYESFGYKNRNVDMMKVL